MTRTGRSPQKSLANAHWLAEIVIPVVRQPKRAATCLTNPPQPQPTSRTLSLRRSSSFLQIRSSLSSWARSRFAASFQYAQESVSYTHLRAHETDSYLVCRLLL